MISLFKEKNSFVVFLIIILSIIVHARFFGQPPSVILPKKNNLLYFLLASLQDLPTIVLSLIYHAVIIVQALLLNYFINNQRLFQNANYIAATCYIIFSGLFTDWQNISPAMIIAFFIILLINLLAGLYNSNQAIKKVFNCGLITGFCAIIFPPNTIIIVVALIAILVLRPFRINEIFCYVSGVILPYYFFYGILFLLNDLPHVKNLVPVFNFHIVLPNDKISFLLAAILIGLSALIGFIFLQNNMNRLTISARKLWIVIILFFILLPVSIFLLSSNNFIQNLFIIIPSAACIAANVFYYSKRKLLTSLLFWISIIACLFINFGGIALIHK